MTKAETCKQALERLPVLALVCDNPQTWAEYLKRLRSDLGWSQAEMSALLGVSPSAIAHYEGGRRIPARNTCSRLGELLTQEAGLPPSQDPFLLEDMP